MPIKIKITTPKIEVSFDRKGAGVKGKAKFTDTRGWHRGGKSTK